MKEKFGTLRFYYRGGFDYTQLMGIVGFAEKVSGTICEDCGASGTLCKRKGWLKTMCPSCAAK